MPDNALSVPKCLADHVADCLEDYFAHLEGHTPAGGVYEMVMQQVELPLLRKVMSYTDGNQSRAAELLGLNRATLRKKLRQHGLASASGRTGA